MNPIGKIRNWMSDHAPGFGNGAGSWPTAGDYSSPGTGGGGFDPYLDLTTDEERVARSANKPVLL